MARWFRADTGRRASLMFGLGMTNNGTGLVLATTALAHVPDVMLPVIFCGTGLDMAASSPKEVKASSRPAAEVPSAGTRSLTSVTGFPPGEVRCAAALPAPGPVRARRGGAVHRWRRGRAARASA